MRRYWLIFLLLPLLLASCAAPEAGRRSPGGGGFVSRSQKPHPLGHGPGPVGFRRVVIDAGHGGKDSGAVSRSTRQKEKDLALDTAQRVRKLLEPKFKVAMIRSRDNFVELDQRVAMASRAGDVLVSIHYNASSPRLYGPEVYYWRVDSHGLATRLQRALYGVSGGGTNSRGLVRRRLRLTRNPTIPCVLVECGYLSNAAEAKRISSPRYRQQLAEAIARAIEVQAAAGDRGTGPLPPPLNQPPSRGSDRRE
jgi:N-acetylmuramoyl-L-alanine amidase